jgi:hypothetical protein
VRHSGLGWRTVHVHGHELVELEVELPCLFSVPTDLSLKGS